ncbi:MAG: FadR family transcriptional regulator [Lachnospiraceae bacterium]|jgi:GntR family transcriptional repressor for pyruvate dehydrogenase complex|nr:FadR family transcriptional regulator [Lachnospiraceae bacterium]
MVQKLKSVKLYEQVVGQLAGQIKQGVYRKGDFLPSEKELIEMTGVSRVTVRQALRILSEMGYIETLQGKGSRVVLEHLVVAENYTEAQMVDFQVHRMNFEMANQVRLMMEPEIARLAARVATPEDIEYMRRSLEIPEESGSVVQKRDFHRMVIRSVKIPYFLDMYSDMNELERQERGWFDEVFPAGREDESEKLEEQHGKILDAIRRHDEEFAYFYMKEHQSYIQQIYKKYFDELHRRYFGAGKENTRADGRA